MERARTDRRIPARAWLGDGGEQARATVEVRTARGLNPSELVLEVRRWSEQEGLWKVALALGLTRRESDRLWAQLVAESVSIPALDRG